MAEDTALVIARERAIEKLGESIDDGSGLDLMTLSTVMIQSGYFPNVEGVAQGVVKILAGKELGFGPIASLRHIYVHKGHIGIMATLMATKIRESKRYDYKVVTCTDEICEIEFFRVGGAAVIMSLGTASFTIEEAKRTGNVKADSAWQTYPSDMLFARAMSRGQRRYCPDVFHMTVYTPEDIDAMAKADAPPPVEEPSLAPRRKSDLPLTPDPVVAVPVEVVEVVEPRAAAQAPKVKLAKKRAAAVTTMEVGGPVVGIVLSVPAPGPMKDVTPAAAPSAGRIQFDIGKQHFDTAGVTKPQLLDIFKLTAKVDQKYKAKGPEYAKQVLFAEFDLHHRADLTAETADQYLVRLGELAVE